MSFSMLVSVSQWGGGGKINQGSISSLLKKALNLFLSTRELPIFTYLICQMKPYEKHLHNLTTPEVLLAGYWNVGLVYSVRWSCSGRS